MGLSDVVNVTVDVNQDVGDAVDIEAHCSASRNWSNHCVGDYLPGDKVEV